MTVIADRLGLHDDPRNYRFLGNGYFAGEPAVDPDDPDSPDGLARILNVPTRVKIIVLEHGSWLVVASTISGADGSWRIDWLDPNRYYTVLGIDGAAAVNSAIQDWVKPAPM